MIDTYPRPAPRSDDSDPAAKSYVRLLWSGGLDLHLQPIVNLRSGEVKGFEALGRLNDAGRLISPYLFLPDFAPADLLELLLQSIDQGLAALATVSRTYPALNLSLNVDPTMLLDPEFASLFLARLGPFDPARITIEILESGEFLDAPLAYRQMTALRAAGVGVALDDMGSGYSSLMRLRNLPVDSIKLDQVFVCELHHKPEDLVFVSSLMSMARGLNKRLIVEGVETPAILDALRVLGVELAQGYAIGRPMPVTAIAGWLAAYEPEPATSRPHSLLGTYAAHLCLVEACRALLNQPLRSAWTDGADNPHACLIGQFFDEQDLHDTPMGLAHKHLHGILPNYSDHRAEWDAAAEDFRLELNEAIQRDERCPTAIDDPPSDVSGCACTLRGAFAVNRPPPVFISTGFCGIG